MILFKKLLAKLRKAKSTISVKTYKKPLFFIISLMIFINLVILVLAAVIALNIDDGFKNFFDAFANGSIKWLILPNSVLVIENPKLLLLAVFVLVVGMVLFSGIIIALTTNQIKTYIEKKQTSSGKLHLQDHIVILNWNNKVPELIADLLYIEDQKITLVLLADIDKTYAERQIQNVISDLDVSKKDIKDLMILVKKGDPLLESDLKDISIDNARAIIIMNEEKNNGMSLKKSDLSVIKIILALSEYDISLDVPFVAEIKDHDSIEKVNVLNKIVDSLKNRVVLPICFDMRLGQIIAQTVIDSKMEELYLSLFSFQDAEVYYLKNTSFEEALKSHPYLTPLGEDKKGVFVLAECDKNLNVKASFTGEIKRLKLKPFKEDKNLDVYIVGQNNKLDFILEAFQEYKKIYQNKFSAQHVDSEEISNLLTTINNNKKESTILLLSDENQEMDALDANVIDTLIFIESNLTNKQTNLIVELFDPKNYTIISNFNIKNTIISNKIISLLLSKLALYPKTAPFYEDLLTITLEEDEHKDKAQIFIKKACDIFVFEDKLSFSSIKEFIVSFYYSNNKISMPIGFVKNDKLQLFYGDLTKIPFIIEKDDYIILINL